ncbi:MAG: VOC family protein [Patescibacteria group bacterium]
MNIYLNFDGQTEEAFNFYKSVFGGEFKSMQRMKDAPGAEKLSPEEQNFIMHCALPIGNNQLMGTDIIKSQGHTLTVGTNVNVSINADTEDDAKKIFTKLAEGGKIEMPIEKAFWGDLFGSLKDKFGIQWMIVYSYNQQN